MRLTASSTWREWPCAVSTTTRSTPASISASVRAKPLSPTVVAAATRSRPCSSLQAFGLATAFSMSLTVIRPTQRYCVVDHQQLLDAVLVQQPLGLVLVDALAHRDELVLGHQLGHRSGADRWRSARRGWSECRPACRRWPLPPPSTTGMPEMPCAFIRSSASASVALGIDGERVHHHAGFEFLHLAHLLGLLSGSRLRWITPMPPACAMAIAICGLGHGVHGGGDDRDVERDRRG